MKNIILFLLLFVSVANDTSAQNFAEWFRQKKTQKKYLMVQIAGLKTHLGFLKEGYKIAKDGLNTISDLKRGEFNLHSGYFLSLKSVNPKIKSYVKVAEIIALQLQIIQQYERAYRRLNNSGVFSRDELAYISRVFDRLFDDCEETLDELVTITTDGSLEMKDDQRINRIDRMHLDMQDNLTFSQSFMNDAKTLAVARVREKKDVQTSRILHGIKKD